MVKAGSTCSGNKTSSKSEWKSLKNGHYLFSGKTLALNEHIPPGMSVHCHHNELLLGEISKTSFLFFFFYLMLPLPIYNCLLVKMVKRKTSDLSSVFFNCWIQFKRCCQNQGWFYSQHDKKKLDLKAIMDPSTRLEAFFFKLFCVRLSTSECVTVFAEY